MFNKNIIILCTKRTFHLKMTLVRPSLACICTKISVHTWESDQKNERVNESEREREKARIRSKSQATGPHALFLHGEKGDLGCQCLWVLHVLCILPLCDDKRQRRGPNAGLRGVTKRRGESRSISASENVELSFETSLGSSVRLHCYYSRPP